MTSFWVIVVVFGQIVVGIGPAPATVTQTECDARAAELTATYDEAFSTHGALTFEGKTVERDDLSVMCVRRDHAPVAGEKVATA